MLKFSEIMKCYLKFIFKKFKLLEKDTNGDTLWTWNYPTMIESEKNFITRKYNSQLENYNIQSFVFSKHGQYWFYIYNNEADSEVLPKVNIIMF
jgi:hypothetical protein